MGEGGGFLARSTEVQKLHTVKVKRGLKLRGLSPQPPRAVLAVELPRASPGQQAPPGAGAEQWARGERREAPCRGLGGHIARLSS